MGSSESVVIVLHEIYGVNDHIERVCESLRTAGFDVICPDLIGRRAFSYQEESLAYSHFVNDIGFSTAVGEVRQLISQVRDHYKHVFLVGYSVGATVAWLCSDAGCDGVVGYYGSRIRDHLEMTPSCPTLLLFPSHEKSFDVNELIDHLHGIPSVRIHQFAGGHGFSNPFSSNHDPQSAHDAFQLTVEFMIRRNFAG